MAVVSHGPLPASQPLWPGGVRRCASDHGEALHVFSLSEGKLARADGGDPTAGTKRGQNKNNFRSGLALDGKRNVLYSLDIDAGELIAIDLAGKQPERKLSLGGRPYDVALARGGAQRYVSDSAGRRLPCDERSRFERNSARTAVGAAANRWAVLRHITAAGDS